MARRVQRARLNGTVLPADPLDGVEGDFYINSTIPAVRFFAAGAWHGGEALMGVSYNDVEYLDDQTSSGSVLTFTFSENVEKIWVEFNLGDPDATDTATARADGVDPDGDTGTLLHNGQVQPISYITDEIRVLAPSGAVVSVYGYRNV